MTDNLLWSYCTLRNLENVSLSKKGREVKESSRSLFIWHYISIYIAEVREIPRKTSEKKAASGAMHWNADLPKEDQALQ